MTDYQENILNEYVDKLKVTDKSINNPIYSLKIFFKYINEIGIDYLKLRISEAQEFQTYLMTGQNDKGKSKYLKSTITVIIGCLTTFYTYLRKTGKILSNPFIEIKKIKRSKSLPRNIFDEEKMNIFLCHLKDFNRGKTLIERKQLYKAHVISELMYSTGMRINEVISLKENDIDLDRGLVKIYDSKTRTERTGILNEYAKDILKIYITRMRNYVIFGKNNGDVNLLFGSKAHLKIWLNMILGRESKLLEYGSFSSHNFRHAVGYHLLKSGCDLRYIQEILGHKQLSSTQIYTRVEKEDLRNVIDKYHPRIMGDIKNEKL